MEYRFFGNTGLKLSVIGLGTVKIGRNRQVKYPGGDGFRLPSDKEVTELLDTAISLGINTIDTAPAYGTSEERLGKLMQRRRDSFAIITKAGEEFENGVSRYDFSAENIQKSVEKSLRRLKTDRIESVLIHCNKDDLYIIEKTPVIEVLQKLKEKGDILSFGVSVNTLEGGIKAAQLADAVMVTYNADFTEHAAIIDYALKLQKGVLIKKGLLSGHLPQNIDNPVKGCIQNILKLKGVTSIIIGTLNPLHLKQNVESLY